MIDKTRVVIGSYNVENLFAKKDLTPDSKTRPKSEMSQAALAENLRQADADIVALQEVSSRETLDSFMKSQNLSSLYPHVAHVPGNSERGINVAIISKYPFETIVTHKDETFPLADGSGETKFSRDFLRADVDVDGVPGADVTVYTTHSKSRRPAAPGEPSANVQRLSEAQAMREIAEKEMKPYPGRIFVLTGDMNDNTDDASVQAILQPKNGGESWLDSLDHLPAGQRNTWPSSQKRGGKHGPEQFDHIIYPGSQDGQMKESEIQRFGKSADGRIDNVSALASDHLMITAEFEISK